MFLVQLSLELDNISEFDNISLKTSCQFYNEHLYYLNLLLVHFLLPTRFVVLYNINVF